VSAGCRRFNRPAVPKLLMTHQRLAQASFFITLDNTHDHDLRGALGGVSAMLN